MYADCEVSDHSDKVEKARQLFGDAHRGELVAAARSFGSPCRAAVGVIEDLQPHQAARP